MGEAYMEILAESESWQDGYAEWLVEQVLCGEYEPYVEGGFIENIEELIPLVIYPKVRDRLIEGWKQYWYGVEWFAKGLSIDMWMGFFYCDRRCILPLVDEVVVVDRDDIEKDKLGGFVEMKTECYTCRLLKMAKFPEDRNRVTNKAYRCSAGRFDLSTRPDGSKIAQYFAWSGIVIPNKTVGKAQTNCPDYQQN